MNIRFLRSARRELFRAAAWYDRARAGLGDELLDEVTDRLKFVKQHPKGPAEYFPPYRRSILDRFPYGIVYRINEAEIVIVAVAHHKRRPGYWLGRERLVRRA